MTVVHVPRTAEDRGEDGKARRDEREHQRSEQKNAQMLRRQRVAERLLAHWPYRAIAQDLGVSLGCVAKDVAKIREEWRTRMARSYDQHVEEEFAKLDRVEMALLPKVLHGGRDGGVSLAAVQAWIPIQDRRARLMGLDKPLKTEITVDVADLDAQRARAQELLDEVAAKRVQRAG